MGIINHENSSIEYRLEVWQVDSRDEAHRQLISSPYTTTLSAGEKHQWYQTIKPAWIGKNQKFYFLLYISGNSEPYRHLTLGVDIN